MDWAQLSGPTARQGCGGARDRHPGASLGQRLMAPVKSTCAELC